MNKTQAIDEAIIYLGEKYFNNFIIEYRKIDDESKVQVIKTGNSVLICYGELCKLFYGLTILKQNYKKENFDIVRFAKFETNGSMIDCSRNQILNIEQVKEIILVSALMGLNRLMLYTEDTYEIKGEPYFGYFRGRYTKEEIKELVDYSNSFGVDLIPCIQTLSHLNQLMRWSQYSNLADSPNTLSINNPEIYKLIEKMISECRENFSSKYIHIGMDEAMDIGLKTFLNSGESVDKKSLILNHLNKVVDIVKKYNFKPIMWIDMFFKIDVNAKSPDWYDFKGNLSDEVKNLIPDVDLVYWNYYDSFTSRYDANLKTSINCGKKIIFAGGLIRWIGLVGNITPSLEKASLGLKTAIKNKIKDTFITTWCDSGSGSTIVTLYTVLALQSAFSYQTGSLNQTSKILKTVSGMSLSDFVKLEHPNKLNENLLPFENPSLCFLYQDILLGLFDTRVKGEFEEKYRNIYLELKQMAKKKSRFAYVFKCYASLCDFLAVKVTLGKKIRNQYQNNDKEGLKESMLLLDLCLKKLDRFMDDYYVMYHKEAKPFGYEVIDGRNGFLRQRILTAKKVICEYLNGKVTTIPELEVECLPYNGTLDDEPHCFNVWSELVTVGKI